MATETENGHKAMLMTCTCTHVSIHGNQAMNMNILCMHVIVCSRTVNGSDDFPCGC